MKRAITYLILVLCGISAGCNTQQGRVLPSLNESYKKDDTKPFGCYVAYNHLKAILSDRYVETQTGPFDETWKNIRDYSANTQYSLYFLVAKNLDLSKDEAGAMREFISEGNDMFIAADYIDQDLLDTIGCSVERMPEIISEVHGNMKDTHVKMEFGNDFKSEQFGYYYYPFLNSFSSYDSANSRVLGVNEAGKPDYVIFFVGKGRLYLHLAPRSFSNYFLLTANNYHYLENVLSYLRLEPKNIYWDEYYKNQSFNRKKTQGSDGGGSGNDDDEKFSSFDVIKKNPPLLWAFWLAIITLLLYILVNIKRKQRVIKEIPPYTNTTVTFTETVGRLYLQKKNNKNIAAKMITYFYEHIRNSYFLNTAVVNNEFINSLARKSNVPVETARELFDSIDKVSAGNNVSDLELLKLNNLIQHFYKK